MVEALACHSPMVRTSRCELQGQRPKIEAPQEGAAWSAGQEKVRHGKTKDHDISRLVAGVELVLVNCLAHVPNFVHCEEKVTRILSGEMMVHESTTVEEASSMKRHKHETP